MPPQDNNKEPMEMVDAVKELRKEYNLIEQKVRELAEINGRGPGGREFSLAITELQSSRHWLGEVLGQLGQENKYKD